ncbi:MAG: hypothetical protein ACRDL3_15530 [Solirubrobacterales bacterium]
MAALTGEAGREAFEAHEKKDDSKIRDLFDHLIGDALEATPDSETRAGGRGARML